MKDKMTEEQIQRVQELHQKHEAERKLLESEYLKQKSELAWKQMFENAELILALRKEEEGVVLNRIVDESLDMLKLNVSDEQKSAMMNIMKKN